MSRNKWIELATTVSRLNDWSSRVRVVRSCLILNKLNPRFNPIEFCRLCGMSGWYHSSKMKGVVLS